MKKISTRKRVALAAGTVALVVIGGTGIFLNGDANTASAQTDTGDAQQAPPGVPVEITTAVNADLAPLAETPGSVVSVSDSLVASATTGKVVWVAEIGTIVKAGDPIARLDEADAILARDEARTDIGRLTARADYLASLYARYEGLEEAGEPAATLDEMRANAEEAKQDLARARVALRRAQTNLERTRVVAPFDGSIATREIQVGEFATPGSPVARLVNTSQLEVTTQVSANLLANVDIGDSVDVTGSRSSQTATVRALVPVGNEVSRTLEIRLALQDGTDWPIGEPVRVSLPSARPRTAVSAHRDTLVLRTNRVSVFRIDNENVAHRVDVEVGLAEGDLVELIGDISAGDVLVVRGGERLRDGQKVLIKTDEEQKSAAEATAS